jgi:hypothetical protein
MGASELLKAVSKGKEKKTSAAKVPFIYVSQELMERSGQCRYFKEQMESLKTQLDIESADLIVGVSPLREQHCISNGFTKSVRIPDEKGLSVMLTWKDRYDDITDDDEKQLEVILKTRKDEFFTEDFTVKAKSHAIEELVKTHGDRFSELFDVERKVVPNRRYTEEFFSAFKRDEREKLQKVVRQNKPALSIR